MIVSAFPRSADSLAPCTWQEARIMAATPGANPSAWILSWISSAGSEGRYAAHDARGNCHVPVVTGPGVHRLLPVPLVVDECTGPAIEGG